MGVVLSADGGQQAGETEGDGRGGGVCTGLYLYGFLGCAGRCKGRGNTASESVQVAL